MGVEPRTSCYQSKNHTPHLCYGDICEEKLPFYFFLPGRTLSRPVLIGEDSLPQGSDEEERRGKMKKTSK